MNCTPIRAAAYSQTECTANGSNFQVLSGVHQGCTVAADLFLNPMDRTVEQSPLSVSVGKEHFTDLDYANDAAFLVEMLQTLVAGLLVLQDEAAPLGLQIN